MSSLRALVVGLFVGLLCVMPWACAKRGKIGPDGNRTTTSAAPSAVVDESLLAYLSSARSLHHEADLYEDKGDVKGAIGALERLLAIVPGKPGPEVDEVLADTRARLAELRAQLGDFDSALEDVAVGLKVAPQVSYFRGHLLEVKGLVLEKRAKALADKGDVEGSKKAKDEAMTAFEDAVAVQGEVIKRGAADGGVP